MSSGGGSGSGRPAVASKPSYLTGGSGSGGALAAKRGTEDLDFSIGDEALAAAAGPGKVLEIMEGDEELTHVQVMGSTTRYDMARWRTGCVSDYRAIVDDH